MAYLVALDDGHGMSTPGKRTPKFPDGSFMHENEFNRAVVAKCKAHLERCGINVLLTAPTDEDIPLRVRTRLANEQKAAIFVSVHANALSETWGTPRGIETFHYPGSVNSRRLAEILQKHLLKGTPLVNRGVKEANFHVLRETSMPSALVECGFMDNSDEARLLMSDQYRSECAEELAQGICEYLAVPYLIEKQKIESLSVNECLIEINNKPLNVKGVIREGKSFIPVRILDDLPNTTIGWDNNSKKATINGQTMETTIVIVNKGFVHSVEAAKAIGYQVEWDAQTFTVKLPAPVK
ncbi:N-acetylmuramoyl-L-alanine amidase [Paenibacillus vandeheii]